ETRTALEGLRMGAYTKIALRIDRAKLGATTLSDAIDLGGGRDTISFETLPDGRDLVIAYLGGDFARAVCESGEREAVATVTERLAKVFGSRVTGAVAAGVLAGWWSDPLARGGYSIAKPGCAGARIALRRPIGDRIWFAGEASAGGGAMTVGGAYLEGERAAAEIARAITRRA
ncbi:MAG: FAD-dependent oxidoreductase, partial [Methylobacteriaceae bacterium]|nr:FAD-dependent oxidoreductase [Methylobacteriaceae bacterium]